MKKWLKWTLIVIAALAIGLFGLYKFAMYNTKKHSPEAVTAFQRNGMDVTIHYCQPGVKGRVIFGELVPYGEVWRTGANEATTFSTATDLRIGDDILSAGDYTLWTIPEEDQWTIIWNGKQYGWGVTMQGAAREAEFDVLNTKAETQASDSFTERFTIDVVDAQPPRLRFQWENTRVEVPFEAAP